MLHLALIGIIVWKFIWQPNIPEHKYVDAPIQARIAQAPKANPLPVSDAQDKKREQERLKKQQQEKERQEKIKREKEIAEKKLKEKAAAEQKAKEQAEVERKKKLALEKKLEEEKRKKAEAEKKRLAEEKRKKEEAEKKRLAEEKRKKEDAEKKRKKEEAERKRKEEERKRQEELERLQKELAAEDGEFFDAMEGDVKKAQIMSERDEYLAMIDAKIQQNWYKPQNPGMCKVQIRTGPGGVVLDAKVVDGTDDATCNTGLAAVHRSEPLPFPEDPDVIEELRVIGITFEPKKKD